jgi:membrane peptidoglycan carboxypeptidase
VVDEGVAFIISDILADNNARRIEFGLNTPLAIPGARVSVKTGTTDNKRDNWTVGYTPDALVATWVGNNDNSPMNPQLASGITGAAPMWNKLMSMMIDETGTPSAVIVPAGIVRKFCAGQYRYFVRGTENSVSCASPPSITPTPTTGT